MFTGGRVHQFRPLSTDVKQCLDLSISRGNCEEWLTGPTLENSSQIEKIEAILYDLYLLNNLFD